MTDGPVFSIVIPVYNVKPYLSSCLDSLLLQKEAPVWEAILVDDGSTDGSGAICDEYAATYPEFRVLHTPNGGVSRARNQGIDAAKGAYLLFLDADDLLDADALAVLSHLLETEPDLVLYHAKSFGGTGTETHYAPPLSLHNNETGRAYLCRCLDAGMLPPGFSASFSLYSLSFLRCGGFHFQPGQVIAEDMDFALQCLSGAGSLQETEHICYYYRQREGSATSTPSPEKHLMHCQMLVKWFRQYPSAPFADYYIRNILRISQLGTPDEVRLLIAFCRENRDILRFAGRTRMRFAAILIRILGFYGGSAAVTKILALRKRLCGH